jgi:MFS family permease
MRVSSFAAGALWWFIGILGMAAGPILGRYADRTTPLQALMAGALMYSAGLAVLVFSWNYVGLLVAAVGYAFMNYPIWGLVGAIANQHFAPGLAVRSVSLGLVAASLGGAVGNAITGPWIDATASFRWPVAAMAIMSVTLVAWYHAIGRDGALEETS